MLKASSLEKWGGQECGGTCNSSDPVTWQTLQSAANTVYGVGTAKANHLINTGDAYGVDH